MTQSEQTRRKRVLVTAALPYSNGRLHVGHIAGAYLPADIYTRYLKLCGTDVRFVCGSDEHGDAPGQSAAVVVLDLGLLADEPTAASGFGGNGVSPTSAIGRGKRGMSAS